MYYCHTRYYIPKWCRWLNADDVNYLDPSNINGLNLYVYANNNPINIQYRKSGSFGGSIGSGITSSFGSNVGGDKVSYLGTSSQPSGLGLGWLSNGLDTGSTIHGLYSSISSIVNHTMYFAKNLTPFAEDMTSLGASIKDGVLAFNQFSWGFGKSDIFGVALGVGLDIYDRIDRGVSKRGVIIGATLTTAKGVGLIYVNKSILYGATTLGTAICPGVGTVVGFVAGGVVCIVVDIAASNWLDGLISKIAK